MKLHNIKIWLLAATTVCLLNCEKNTFKVTQRTGADGKAGLKIGYFSPYTTQPNTILYVNGQPVSNVLTSPISFPGGGFNMGGSSNGDYLRVDPGTATIGGIRNITGTGNAISQLFNFSTSVEADKFYTYFVTDTFPAVKGFTIEDNLSTPDSGFVSFKFVNCMPNLPAVDLYKGTSNTVATLFASNVAFQTATTASSIAIPTDSFFVRPAGAAVSTVPMVRRAFAANMTNKRVYTMLLRGYNGQTSVNLVPNLSLIVNQ